MKKIDKNYFIITAIAIISIILIIPFNHIFGSTTDWISQHIVFPDYFRNLFYETHDFFPSLAANIGSGQNIYYFSYYGLFNPIILISYLLPFIDMTTYIMGAMFILYISFGLLTYKWLKGMFSPKLSLLLSIISLLASPVLFHFHRHFMFVSYLPFLILAFMGVDKYFKSNRSNLLIISILLIILTSYYYSIISIIAVIIYYLYIYISKNNVINFKKLIIDLLKLSIPIIIAIFISCVLLIPTLFALLDGRTTGDDINLLSLLIPKLNIDSIVYSSYTIGLTAISVISTIFMFQSKEKNNRFLSLLLFIIITIPLFIYLLNGTLYIRDKILIPFLPLFIILTGKFLNDLFDKKIKLKLLISIIIATSILFYILGYHKLIYYIEVVFILLCILIYYKKNIKYTLIIFILISSVINFFITNDSEEYISVDVYNNLYNTNTINNINDVLDKDSSVVRFSNLKDPMYSINKVYGFNHYQTSVYSSTSSSIYKNFYTNIIKNNLGHRNNLILASTGNIFYNIFMGVKYIYSDYDIVGYNELESNIYINDDVLPIMYVNNNTLDLNTFNNISYPYNLDVLLKNTIIENSSNKTYKSNIKEYDLKYTYKDNEDLIIEKENGIYYITAKKDTSITLDLDRKLDNDIIILDFRLNNQHECSVGDSEIKINNVVNKLTCNRELYQNNNYVFHYVLSSNKTMDKLKISIKEGIYIIDDIHTYILSYDDIKNVKENVVEVKIDKQNTKGDVIIANVSLEEEGYLVTTLPYDKGYKIYIDDILTDYEKVNTSFIGLKLDKGNHNIKIVYTANGLQLGKILSVIGIISLILNTIIEKKVGKSNVKVGKHK